VFKKLGCVLLFLALGAFAGGSTVAGQGNGHPGKKTPPGLAKKGHVPPGLAKKRGCLPPGLAKKAGARSRCNLYMAVDPRHDDRAWFLIEGRWILRELDDLARGDLKAQLALHVESPPRPDTPLPNVSVDLRLMWFGD